MASPTHEHKIKMAMIGPMATGKTSLVHYLEHNEPAKYTISTVGGAVFHQIFLSRDSTRFSIELWDTAGQERYSTALPLFLRGSHVVLAVFDVTDLESLEALPRYLDVLFQSVSPDCQVIVAANKQDLIHDPNDLQLVLEHSTELLTSFANPDGSNHIKVLPTSAQTGQGIAELLSYLTDTLEQRLQLGPNSFIQPSSVSVSREADSSAPESKKSGCC